MVMKPQIPGNIVYLKPVAVADLPAEVQEQAVGVEQIFAVHNADGRQIALVADRGVAIELARRHDMVAMTLH